MIEAGFEDSVRQFRQQFQNQMAERLIGDRTTHGPQGGHLPKPVLFKPHIVCELFFFDDFLDDQLVRQTAAALTDHDRGTVSGDDVELSDELTSNLDASLRGEPPAP